MGIEEVVIGKGTAWKRGVSWFARFKPSKKEPFVVWKVKMPDGTERCSPDLLSQEELDYFFRRVYEMAMNFLAEKKPDLLLPAEIMKELMTAGEAGKNVETSLRKLWIEYVRSSKLIRLKYLLEFRMIGKKGGEKEREEYEEINNRVLRYARNQINLREDLSRKEKEWEWFWVEDAKQFSKAIKSEYKKIKKLIEELIEKLIEKDNRAVKKRRVGLLIERQREEIAREMVQFLMEKSKGNKEVMEAKIKELEAIGQDAIDFFEKDLTQIRKRVERRLEGAKTRWQRGVDWLQKWIYPIVPAAVVAVVGFLTKCNGKFPWP